ncbi:DEAD/H associated domain protein [Methanococcus vannielii SB]|uniref:DEAD/H associated domain protein n=1 Tax=Methanococcus vannielii (strain ATCC 35089 / DSM 1224 / JCM 13029 / OCM 148 / SB) TaxID=406327 RepID=A6UPE8_METVS|nr:ATP-dependent helicase [Methanococcus vannielii]ABR54370.1 DEAD/H associated domain protein [Methanococcus vannielii SB]
MNSDSEILDLFEPAVKKWWLNKFEKYKYINEGYFTPPQRQAIPRVHFGRNTLICSPTGSGKTLSSFIGIINELFRIEKTQGLKNSIYCLYISPLKSLANDIHLNLEEPLTEIQKILKDEGKEIGRIRHSIRHGDTSNYEKSRMLDKTPHILNTTPETLAIILNSPKFREKLKTIQWVIIDEIHALSDSKRGSHLSLSLERLREITETEFLRIGCSATVEPLEEVADYLGGYYDDGNKRPVEIVDTRFVRGYDLKLMCPVDDLIDKNPNEISEKLYGALDNLIQTHESTLIFTNTRGGAEKVLYNLRKRYPSKYNDENSGCHHGSLSKEKRVELEDKLKTGRVKFATTSSSLELGIDMPYIDIVIQIGSPKSVRTMLQRIGRSGHGIGRIAKGRIIALDRDELLECAVMLKKATEGFIDKIHIPKCPIDVLTQHVYGIAINQYIELEQVKKIIRRSYTYHEIKDGDFDVLLNYMTASHVGMDERKIYSKIWYDPVTKIIGKSGRTARIIYYMNIGTIPDDFSCDVYLRGTTIWIGKLDEQYLDRLEKGDVFTLGGEHLKFQYRRGSKVYVDKTSEKPNIPSWYSERLPLSYELGRNILLFKKQAVSKYNAGLLMEYLSTYPLDTSALKSLYGLFEQQIQYKGNESVSTLNKMVIEGHIYDKKMHYYFHSNYGRKFNDGLSRAIAYTLSKKYRIGVLVSISDTGFSLEFSKNQKIDILDVVNSLNPENISYVLKQALNGTNLLKRMFRINATRSLMILRNYIGKKKSAKKQQVNADLLINYAKNLDKFAPLEETYREIIEDSLEIDNLKEVLNEIQTGKLKLSIINVPIPTPMSFGIATLNASDSILAENKNQLLKDFHQMVLKMIEYEKTVKK